MFCLFLFVSLIGFSQILKIIHCNNIDAPLPLLLVVSPFFFAKSCFCEVVPTIVMMSVDNRHEGLSNKKILLSVSLHPSADHFGIQLFLQIDLYLLFFFGFFFYV